MKKTILIVILILGLIFSFAENTGRAEMETFLQEEAYVNDIPFNTEEVVRSKSIELDDEQYVDDIPFDTKNIFDKYQKNKN